MPFKAIFIFFNSKSQDLISSFREQVSFSLPLKLKQKQYFTFLYLS